MSLEASLERVELMVREGSAGLTRLLGLARTVAVSTRRDLVVFTWRFTREEQIVSKLANACNNRIVHRVDFTKS